jgi:hypothetical protein
MLKDAKPCPSEGLAASQPGFSAVQQGFDAVRAETGAKASYQYSDVIASTLVHFYKQGFEKKCVYLCSRRRYRARFSGVNDLCRLEVRRPSRRL